MLSAACASAQRVQKGVVGRYFGFAAKAGQRLHQALADALGQLARGGAGKRHHQNVWCLQCACERAGFLAPAAVAQHQAQV